MHHENLTLRSLGDLVQPDRVHRSLYIDPDVFELEMERIFCRTWVYVGHESQVPSPGDYLATRIGVQPVLLVRHADGEVYVLHNRCGHRGALVCNEQSGNTGRSFRCAYHGWTFKTNGELLAAPLKGGYPEQYDLKAPEFGMVPIKTDSHRGFIFANIAGDGPFSLPAEMAKCLDALVERSPVERVSVPRSGQRYIFHGNWKAQLDNVSDVYHAPYSHESTINRGQQFSRREGAGGISITEDDEPGRLSKWDRMELRAFPGGHSFFSAMSNLGDMKGAWFDDYVGRLKAHWGEERTKEILVDSYHNATVFPNLNVQLLNQFIRVICPIAVDRTLITVYPIFLEGVPEEMNSSSLRHVNVTHSPASFIQTDDLEMFRRIDVGLRNVEPEWVVLGRRFRQESITADGNFVDQGTSELSMRGQFEAWKQLMVDN